jgi:TolA-binding protein
MKKCLTFSLFFCFLISCGGSLLVKGDESLQEGMIDDAIKAYSEILNDKGSSAEEKKTAASRIADCFTRKGLADLDKDNTDDAIVNFEKSGNTIALTNLNEIYYTRGIKAYQSQKYPESIEFLEKSAAAADKAKLPRKDGLDEKAADSYFQLGEKEFTANKFDAANKYFEPLTEKYDKTKYSRFADALLRMFLISNSEHNEDSSLQYLSDLRKVDPKYAFDSKTKDLFSRTLSKLTHDAELEIKKKNYDEASAIVEKASVLPNFDDLKQKQFKARIVFFQGKDLILEGEIDEGLVTFDRARGIDANIITEINDFVNTDFVRSSKDLQKKKEYQASIDKLLLALRISPNNKDLIEKVIPDAYYELGNSNYIKKEYKIAFRAIRDGLALNKDHKQLKALSTRFEQTANAIKNSTKKEFSPIAAYIEEQFRDAVASDKVLGTYAGKKIRWQFKVIGTEVIRGKLYGKFLFDKTIVYGLPSESLDAQFFASGCEDSKNKMEAVLEGNIGYIEELLGVRYLVINVNKIQFVDILE